MTSVLLLSPFAPDPFGNLLARRARAYGAFYRSCGFDTVHLHFDGAESDPTQALGFSLPRHLLEPLHRFDLSPVGEYLASSIKVRKHAAIALTQTGAGLIHLADISLLPLARHIMAGMERQVPTLLDQVIPVQGSDIGIDVPPELVVVADPALQKPLTALLRGSPVLLLPHGRSTDEPPSRAAIDEARWYMQGQPYAVLDCPTVPRADGMVMRLFRDGCFFVPPVKSIAVLGSLTETLFHSPDYQRFLHANSDRVQFFADPSADLRRAVLQGAQCHLLPADKDNGLAFALPDMIGNGQFVIATPQALVGHDIAPDRPDLVVCRDVDAMRKETTRSLTSPRPAALHDATTSWPSRFATAGLSTMVTNLLGATDRPA